MRRFPAAVMWLFVVALPVCALGASSHGGFGGHAGASHATSGFRGSGFSGQTFHGPAFQGGSSRGGTRYAAPSGPYRFTTGPRFTGNGQGAYPASRFVYRPGMNGRSTYATGPYRQSRYREPYRSAFAYGGLPWYGPWLNLWGPDFLDYPDDSAYDNGAITPYAPDYSGQGYDYPPADQANQDQMAPPSNYQPFYGMQPDPRTNAPVSEEAVTLIFKDHRPNQVIHNYLLTGTTLTVWDRNPRNIPVNEIDIAATEKTNRDAGVDFYLPGDVKQ